MKNLILFFSFFISIASLGQMKYLGKNSNEIKILIKDYNYTSTREPTFNSKVFSYHDDDTEISFDIIFNEQDICSVVLVEADDLIGDKVLYMVLDQKWNAINSTKWYTYIDGIYYSVRAAKDKSTGITTFWYSKG